MKIALGSDHAGYDMKEKVKAFLQDRGIPIEDFGTHDEESVDYTDFGKEVARRVSDGTFERGILICGTGLGMSMVANRFRGVRAALANDLFSAIMSRRHNDANILVMGGRLIGDTLALQLVKTEALQNNFDRVGFVGSPSNNLRRIAHDLGGQVLGEWKHQLRVPSILRLLQRITPVLEKRLVGSMFEGLTRDLTINTFRNCYLLKFVSGKIESIVDIGMQEVDEHRGFRAPPSDLIRLILGVYDIDELKYNNIDFIVNRDLKSLVATLFPKGESNIYYYMC